MHNRAHQRMVSYCLLIWNHCLMVPEIMREQKSSRRRKIGLADATFDAKRLAPQLMSSFPRTKLW